jgi:ribosomal protein S18 acetylase RimI-like enzyme
MIVVPLETTSDPMISTAIELLSSVGKQYSSEDIDAITHLGYVVAAVETGDVIGVATALQWLASDTEAVRERIDGLNIGTDPVALHIHDVVTSPAWRRRGVGTELVRFLLRRATYGESTHRFARTLATSRIPSTCEITGTSYGLLRRLGFREIGRFPTGYYAAAIGWHCPDCYGEPCSCSGRMMMWERE